MLEKVEFDSFSSFSTLRTVRLLIVCLEGKKGFDSKKVLPHIAHAKRLAR